MEPIVHISVLLSHGFVSKYDSEQRVHQRNQLGVWVDHTGLQNAKCRSRNVILLGTIFRDTEMCTTGARACSEARQGSERLLPAACQQPVPSIRQNTCHLGSLWPLAFIHNSRTDKLCQELTESSTTTPITIDFLISFVVESICYPIPIYLQLALT